MIPKKIFFYWSGSNLSWMRYMTLYSFRKFNPDWEITLYVSDNKNKIKTWSGVEEQDFINYKGINYLNKIDELNIKIKNIDLPDNVKNRFLNISPVHESDIFRYYKLYKDGGFYCDLDVLFFRPIDDFYNEIIENKKDTIIHQEKYYMTIGFLGSSINNEYFKDIFNYATENFNMSNYQSLGVDLIYKKFGGSREKANIIDKVIKKYDKLNFYNIPSSLIYKFDWTMIDYNFKNKISVNQFPKESIGYHWFGGSKISQHYNNKMSENNYFKYNTTFSEITKTLI